MSDLRAGTAVAALAVLALLAAASPAAADTRFASPGGSGPAGSCPRGNPCEIHDAIEHMSVGPGDVVNLLPGTYNIGDDDIEIGEAITVQGLPGAARPTVIGDYTSTVIEHSPIAMFADGSVLRDIKVENNEDSGLNYAVFTQADVTIERAFIIAKGSSGFGLLLKSSGGTSILRDSIVWSQTEDSALITGGPDAVAHLRVTGVTAFADEGIALLVDSSFGSSEVVARNVIARTVGTDIGDVDVFVDGTNPPQTAKLDIASSNYDSPVTSGSTATL